MHPLENLSRYDIVLGSASPRRRELFNQLAVNFTVEVAPGVDEVYPPSLEPQHVPEYLSRLKAAAFDLSSPGDNRLIITADTVVIVAGEVLGKPRDRHDAVNMLHKLSGRTHEVVTGVTIRTRDIIRSFSATTQVTFATLTHDEIDFYIDNFRPFDKAGAYGIQEWIGSIGISHISGSFYNVMGLPLHRLYSELTRI